MADNGTRGGATLDPPRPAQRRAAGRDGEPPHALAALDELTGLRNQRALWRELSRRVPLSSPGSPLAVVMLDVDRFDDLNAEHGQAVGHRVLQRAAAAMRDVGASPRLAFRSGGDEFVLLVPGDADTGRAFAENLTAQIESQNGDLPAVTVSCGVAALDAPVEPWVVLDRADAALREAKRDGGNAVVVAGRTAATADAYLVAALEHEAPRRAALALAVANVTSHDGEVVEDPEDVLTLCEAVGRRLGLEGAELNRLLAGAQLHDVGKVAIPPEIFNKPGPLSPDERALVGEHTVIGEGILRSVPEMAEVATIVRHSHEHWDGSGYPDGLSGEEIPLPSRIVLCASAFRAIRTDRPYRAQRSSDEAIAELRECAGTQFDPAVVAAFLEVAESVRRQHADPAVVTALPRSRRLVALLAALAISTGTAFAAIPEVEHLIHSIFGTSTGPSDVISPGADARGFSLGPLGDVLSIKPVKVRDENAAKGKRPGRGATAVVPLSLAVSRAHANDPTAPAAPPRTVFGPDEGSGGDSPSGGGLRDEPHPAAPGDPGPGSDPEGPGSGPGEDPAPTGQGPPAKAPAGDTGPDTAPGPTPPGDPGPVDPGPGDPGPGDPSPGDPRPGPDPGPGPDPDPPPPPSTGKNPPPRKPAESPGRSDEAHEPGSPGRPDNPGRTDPPGRAS